MTVLELAAKRAKANELAKRILTMMDEYPDIGCVVVMATAGDGVGRGLCTATEYDHETTVQVLAESLHRITLPNQPQELFETAPPPSGDVEA